jgi:multiple sugar transport system permease protein
MVVLSVTVAVAMSFATGEAFRPSMLLSLLWGALAGGAMVALGRSRIIQLGILAALIAVILLGIGPVLAGAETSGFARVVGALILGAGFAVSLAAILYEIVPGALNRHEFEGAVIRFLTGFGYIFFTAIVLIPFYVMVMTSLKNQSELIQNPLDFSIDLSKGVELFRSYDELFTQFNFGTYLFNSFFISVLTVFITLAFAIPGAYAVARLRFRGQAAFSRSILLIYMVPMIVLALPIYIAFSMTGLRNSFVGIVLIYPVTTIPVALYMLQGYFRGLPAEIEEAGLMDGLSRLAVIWKITLPLSLPALASVSLYVFMIAWNEFLLAFMLLDDPTKFTLTRGIAALNSSEIPRQHLMAGSVIATVPIMALFLGLERFMTKGLTAGSVKG